MEHDLVREAEVAECDALREGASVEDDHSQGMVRIAHANLISCYAAGLAAASARCRGTRVRCPPEEAGSTAPTSSAASRSAPRSTPVPISMFSKVKARSSVAVLPEAPGAKGQPPSPEAAASNTRTPA